MIHPTSFVHPEAQIDPSCEVGPYCIIGSKVKLGKNNKLLSHVVIDNRTEMGSGNTVYPFSVLGAIPQDLKYKGEDTKLIIGDRNTIRESCTLNLGTVQGGGVTKLGNDSLLMAYTHFGHDCIVGNHCIIANAGALAGHAVIEDYVTIGGMVGVGQFVRVGAHAYVAGQSGIERDVPPYSIIQGSRPCVIRGANIVGMRRRGFKAEIITIINEAIKLWTRPEVQKEQCLLEIESQYGEHKEIQSFLEFIRSSESGVVR